MKRYTLLLITLFVLPMLTQATDKEQPIESTVEEVTVYQDGAQLTRQATVTLSPGRNEILFKGLTESLDGSSIQLTGSGDFVILSTRYRRDYLEDHPQKEQLKKLTTRRDSLEQRIQDKKTEKSVLDRELNILMSNTNLKGDGQNLSASDLKQAMDYFHEKLSDLETQKLGLSRELSKLEEELQKVKNQISELDSNATQNSSVVTAALQTDSEQQVQLRLTYFVSDAGWTPSYDLRVSDIDSPVNLSYKANVYQNTGVNWNDVSLEISSAKPDRGGPLPDLEPWYLQFYEQEQESAARTMSMDASISAEYKRDRGPNVQEEQNQTSFSYKVEQPYDVPSVRKYMAVKIKNAEIAAEYSYYTVPKRRNRAYLTANVSNWEQYNLLAGEVNLFLEGAFVGQSTIKPQSVEDTLSFSLGRDESIVTERKKLEEFEGKNFFGGKVRESFAWEISVRNTKNQPINIEVNDQVPVSQNEDINVSVQETSGANYNQQNGMLSWQLQLDPGEAKTVQFEYEVEYPKGREVTF